jgi:hypothetical protein
MDDLPLISIRDLPCCPEVSKDPCCDRLVFTYRLSYNLAAAPVEIVLRLLLERCPGPLAVGDLVYSTTLLPGETVRLFTSSRKNRFTFDSESKVSYRHEQASEESFYMSAMDRFMSDLTVKESGGSSSSSSGSFKSEGSVSGAIESFFVGPSAEVAGSYNGSSTFDFLRELSSHAESSHERSVQATRAASSITVGEVQSRTHAEGTSEDTFEASTRTIENRNQCHAVTYFAYQFVKRQTTRLKIVGIVRRVRDPAGNAVAETRPQQLGGDIQVLPAGVLATAAKRVEIETQGRTSIVADRAGLIATPGSDGLLRAGIATATRAPNLFAASALGSGLRTEAKPIPDDVRAQALEEVDADLIRAGVLDAKTREPSAQLRAAIEFERTSCLPTSAVFVKGCIDPCNTCEDARQTSIRLDLERKELENKLLQRQIQLLEKSQEYRCCPAGETEEDGD